MEELARQLGTAAPDVLSAVFEGWEGTVGQELAAHARPERIEGEVLVVSVDSPALASHLRTIAPRVIERLREATGSDGLSRLVIRVRAPKKGLDVDN